MDARLATTTGHAIGTLPAAHAPTRVMIFSRSIHGYRQFSLLLRAAVWLTAAAFASAALAQFSQGKPGAVVTTEQVRAELLAHAPDGAAAGSTVWVGLQLAHQPEWHTYWKNSGDSGLPTQLAWTLPKGVSAGEIAWPVPRKYTRFRHRRSSRR